MPHARIDFHGQFDVSTFSDWIRHRATKLGLTGRLLTAQPNHISLEVSGPEELLNAMEVACSLGPINCLTERSELTWIDPGSVTDWPNCFEERETT